MIESRPKRQTIFSLGIFTMVILVGLVYFWRQIVTMEEVAIWRYIITAVLLISATLLLHKLIFNYKVLKISHDQVHIYYPFRFSKTVQEIKDLGAWQETIIDTTKKKSTKKTEFKQLKLVFVNKGFVKISNQENSGYDQVHKYIKRKAPKKEVRD